MPDTNQKSLFNPNEKNVINIIRKYRRRYGHNFNKNDIASALGIQWTTVANILASLDKRGNILKSVDDLELASDYEYYVGISVGSSRIKIVFLDFKFEYITKNELRDYIEPYEEFVNGYCANIEYDFEDMRLCLNLNHEGRTIQNPAFVLNDLCNMLIKMKTKGARIATVGFAFPGIIDKQNKKILSSYLFGNAYGIGLNDLIEENVFMQFEELFGDNSYFLDQNSNAATVAEKEREDVEEENAAVIYGGYGYGLGLILGNRLQVGGGQLGHMIVVKSKFAGEDNLTLCRCGQPNCLENRINTDVYGKISGRENELKSKSVEELEQVLKQEENGNKKKIFADYLSQAIYNIIQFVGVKNIILTGKLSKLYSSISMELKNALLEKNITSQVIKTSELGEFAAAVGIAIEAYYSRYDMPLEWKY